MNNQSISAHQTGAIAGILLFTLKMSSLPSLFYKYNKTGAILSVITVVVLNALFLGLVVWLKQKYKNMSLYAILSEKLGVFLTIIIYFVFFALFFLKLLLMVSDAFTFIKDVADDEYSIFKVFLCFLPIIATMAFSGLKNVARTCEFFLPVVILCLITAISFSIIPINAWSFGSLIKEGASGFFNSIFRLSFWTGDLFALLIFLDKIELKKGKVKEMFLPFSFMAIILIVLYFLYYVLYQETSIFHVNLLNDVVQYAIGTSKGWHMDIFAIIVYIINMYLQGAVLIYCASECLKQLLNYKNTKISLFVIVLGLLCAEFLYLTDYLNYVAFAENILCYFSSITIVLIILLLLIFVVFKKDAKNSTPQNQLGAGE